MSSTFLSNPLGTKFARKIFVALALSSLLPLVIVFLFFQYFLSDYLRAQQESQLRARNRGLINALITHAHSMRKNFADYCQELTRSNGAEPSKQMKRASATIPLTNLLVFRDGAVSRIYEKEGTDTRSFSELFQNLIPNLSMRETIEFIEKDKAVLINANANGTVVGIYSLRPLFTEMNRLCEFWDQQCLLINDKRQVVWNSFSSFIPTKANNQGIIDKCSSSRGNSFEHDFNGETFIGVRKNLAFTNPQVFNGWTIVSLKRKEAMLGPLRTFKSNFPILLLTCAAGGALLSLFVTRKFTVNIDALINGTRRVGDHDFNHQVVVQSGDELEDLANSFNKMAKHLYQTTMSKDHLATTLRSIDDGVVVTDNEEKIIFLNETSEKWTGWSEKDAFGHHLTEVFRLRGKWDSRGATNPARQVLKGKKPIKLNEAITIEHADHPERKIVCGGAPIRRKNSVVGTVLVFRDATETLELEEQLRHMQKTEAIGTLASGIAHDFNNILGVILGFLEITIPSVPKERKDIRGNLKSVYKAGIRAKDLVAQILAFSRKSNSEPKPMSLTPLLKELMKMIRTTIPATFKVTFISKLDNDHVIADPSQLHQVIMNLCANAYHAMKSQGKGELRLELTEITHDQLPDVVQNKLTPDQRDWLSITVSDTGEGIKPEHLNRIFDPYFTTKEKGEGTGLGLAVAHGIIAEHGGEITVSSVPGATTFQIILPKSDVSPTLEDKIDGDVLYPRGSERILLVDDDKDFLRASSRILEFLGYDVTAHTNSATALAQFKTTPDDYDLIITDQFMPELTGTELARDIHERRPGIPVILCTGTPSSSFDSEMENHRIYCLISKPLDIREVSMKIRDALNDPFLDDDPLS